MNVYEPKIDQQVQFSRSCKAIDTS